MTLLDWSHPILWFWNIITLALIATIVMLIVNRGKPGRTKGTSFKRVGLILLSGMALLLAFYIYFWWANR